MRILRDPVYGYIELGSLESSLVDTPEFQRLRRITQTSYSSVYPSALHNRFVHSLGVHHLGKMAFQTLKPELKSLTDRYNTSIDLDTMEFIFTCACLLHDVGHSPFSHTCEHFYELAFKNLKNRKYPYMTGIEIQLYNETRCFRSNSNIKEAAKHESMSAMVGAKLMDSTKSWAKSTINKQKEFFARCITGYLYPEKHQIENCIISLLNSSTIDVDRIDYLLRDAYFSGYPNVPIDYRRLLGNLTIIDLEDNLKLGYRKNAISILENAVYAHDSERKWIQNHPVIVYENYLINGMVNYISSEIYHSSGDSIINPEAISNNGIVLNNESYRLLSDDDIIYLSKKYPCSFSNEYHNRSIRRKPCWKSEQEFTSIIKSTLPTDSVPWIMDRIKYIYETLNESKTICINSDLIEELDSTGEKKEGTIKFLNGIKNKLTDFDVVMLEASRFSSGFKKTEFKDILITFPDKTRSLREVSSLISQSDLDSDKYFYVYSKNDDDRKKMIIAIEEGYRQATRQKKLDYYE